MKRNNAEGLVLGAAVRAAVLSVLANSSKTLPAREIREAPPVKATGVSRGKFDSIIYLLHKSHKIARYGEVGSFEYGPVTTNGATVPAVITPNRAVSVKHGPASVKVDFDHRTGRIRLEFNGNFILDLGKS